MNAGVTCEKLQVLLSTVSPNLQPIIEKLNLQCDLLIIQQDSTAKESQTTYKEHTVHVVSVPGKGLSRSRNLALEHATGDICLIADDDVTYADGLVHTVLNAYYQLPEADVVIFPFKSSNVERDKRLGKSIRRLGYLHSLRVASVMISFRRQRIAANKISFNEHFGSGSTFQSGEENIFLFECLRRGLKIYYYPEVISSVDFSGSSWFAGFNEQYFRSKGALSQKLFGRFWFLFVLQFAFRKYALYRKQMPFLKAIGYMRQGRSFCLNLERNGRNMG